MIAQMNGDEQTLPPLHQLNSSVRPLVAQLVERGMDVDPAQWPTAREFLSEIDAILYQPHIPAPLEPAQPPEIVAFVGRGSELDSTIVVSEADRLAAIIGPPGVGKTAIAVILADRFGDPARTFWHTFHQDEGIDSLIWDLASFLAWNGQADLWQLLQGTRLTGGQPPPPEALCNYPDQAAVRPGLPALS